jgi:hypothetical protein
LNGRKSAEFAEKELPMAKSVKKSGAAPKAAAKPRKSADNNPAENKLAKKTSAEIRSTGNKSSAKKPVASANGTTNGINGSITHDQVALLAHRFWIERGRKHGHHEEDWFRAEQELRAKAS